MPLGDEPKAATRLRAVTMKLCNRRSQGGMAKRQASMKADLDSTGVGIS